MTTIEPWYDGPLKRADGSEVRPPSYGDLGAPLPACRIYGPADYNLCPRMLNEVEARRQSWVPTESSPVWIRNEQFGAPAVFAIRKRMLVDEMLIEGVERVCPFCGGCLVLGGCP
jgi:hypothetical protein